jgi:hypothetical protein
MSDREQFGKEDVWSLPATGRGDCEDFALMKRKLLIERGWPSSALLLTAALTPQGDPASGPDCGHRQGGLCSRQPDRHFANHIADGLHVSVAPVASQPPGLGFCDHGRADGGTSGGFPGPQALIARSGDFRSLRFRRWVRVLCRCEHRVVGAGTRQCLGRAAIAQRC